jgi:6-phosphofructokinase 1
MKSKIKRLGVLTSGGDSPGMNAAIRAVVRTGIYHGLEVFGIMRGFQGLIENDIYQMESRSVANIIQRGGTILKTARCKEFMTTTGMQKAFDALSSRGIEALIIIGGDGSFRGAVEFSAIYNFPVIGIAGTIDKDIQGTDYTIGFDTAVNTAVEAIDKIRDTADAHDRLFIIEVMGRDAGYIALHSGIATGAEHILVPERKTDMESLMVSLEEKEKRKKLVNIVVVAEGEGFGGADEVAKAIKKRLPQAETRVCILGHIQRGGAPSCVDRLIASRMGYHAVECLMEGRFNVFVGILNNKMNYMPLESIGKKKGTISEEWMKIVKILAS